MSIVKRIPGSPSNGGSNGRICAWGKHRCGIERGSKGGGKHGWELKL